MKPNLIEIQMQRASTMAGQIARKARQCPVCPDTELVSHQLRGVEICYCPQCRGSWLDRGVLDQILDRALRSATEPRIHRAPLPGYRDRNEAGRLGPEHPERVGQQAGRSPATLEA